MHDPTVGHTCRTHSCTIGLVLVCRRGRPGPDWGYDGVRAQVRAWARVRVCVWAILRVRVRVRVRVIDAALPIVEATFTAASRV